MGWHEENRRGIDSDTVEELVLAAEELVLAAEELVLAAEELVLAAAEELPAITQALRDLSQYAQANKASTVALTTDQVSTVKSTFKCLICRDVMKDPVVAPCCRSLVVCRTCITEWTENSPHCPKCRDESFPGRLFEMTGMQEVIDMLRDIIRG
ncbi:hypothetical protein KUCAC02_029441 [Chaenocephalus aceratus]|nr:hypothetical protein KUCAC02_029441 [Chaenocephalus aceratus]